MKRLILISLASILFPSTWGICQYFYPDNIIYWDSLKHGLYVLIISLTASINLFEPVVKYEKYVTLGVYGLVFGELIPALIDRCVGNNNFVWYDIVFVLIAIYGGCKDIFPLIHRRIALIFINEKIYYWLCRTMK